MKKISKIFPSVLGLLVIMFFMLSSCDKMNDIQQQYADREETVYLGMVDSIVSFAGFGRAKITWYVSADPKIEKTVIYWNMRQDSIVKEIVRDGSGLHKDSVILEDMPEGTSLFEFRNTNNRGESSLYSIAGVTVWGPEYGDGLLGRRLTSFDFDIEQSIYNLSLSPTTDSDDVLYSEIVYTNSAGVQQTVQVKRDQNTFALPNFSTGAELQFRNVFSPKGGFDVVYSNYQVFKAPVLVSRTGTKIGLQGDTNSKYFDRFGEVLYEWNANGDLITYTADANGTLTQTEIFPAIAPRTQLRDLFFYDADRFIGVLTGNQVTMQQLQDGQFLQVGAPTFGSGFSFIQFMPTRGFFFTRSANGEIKYYKALNNATWGTPTNVIVGPAGTFGSFGVMALYNHRAMLAVDAEGYLWTFPVAVSGSLGAGSRIGSGWNRFERLFSVGEILYAMEANGDIYVFNDFNTTENYWKVD